MSGVPKPIAAGGPLLTRGTRRRRERLSDLERNIDLGTWEDRRRAVRALLARPLIIDAGEDRTLLHRHREWLTLWFAHHVGWELHIDAEACRLVKRPAHTRDASRPCRDPASKDTALTRRAYVFICLVLGVLTQEGRQVTLKHLADRLNGIRHAEPEFEECGASLQLDRRESRRDLVHALRVLLDWGVLARIDGSEDRFVTAEETDVLYNVRHAILGRLLTARQPPSLVHTPGFEARLNALWQGAAAAADSEDWHTRQIRYGLFRRLLDDPVLYYQDLDEDERQYLDTQRPHIIREIEQATGLLPEIRKEGIAMVDRVGDLSDYHLPETGTDGHLTLLIATWLAEELRNSPGETVSLIRIEGEIRKLADAHNQWRKDARQKGSETVLARETIARLGALGLLRSVSEPEPAVIPLPAIGRFGLRVVDKPFVPQETLF